MKHTWLVLLVLVLALSLTACTYRVTTPPGAQASSAGLHPRACLGIEERAARDGVRIVKVLPGSPAAAARLSMLDVIMGFAGYEVTTPARLNGIVAGLAPGALVDVTYASTLLYPPSIHHVQLHLGQWDHQTCVPVVTGP